ncbi:MAG: ABC-2 transporter permease [Erysipelotrichaceae bacterium]|nr:ABC-2 transporter permease [Erysipelotrichaceae bacterium]
MKGLLIKDFHITFQNQKYLLIYLVCCIGMCFVIDSEFMVGYIAMLMGIISISTISYDEFDNGFPFLMSLPVDSKTYVRSKFLFCLLMEAIGVVFGITLVCVTAMLKGDPVPLSGLLSYVTGVYAATALMICCLIPIQLKYGAEKGRLVMMLFYGVIAVVIILVGKIPTADGTLLATVARLLSSVNPALVGTVAAGIAIAFICCLYFISVSIMNKKEF